ncbi:hypothetical protein K2173_014488 [Erythroxylum novogranatense]|uniref:THO1-MOS11 C-terminal domain-containing protein n=1 Tax=Erythroxylum novogranatense TaxID=1862640 RepID=A0AAV8S4G6_9ROSI|nr:hypothetical protein K2173_014488 [Erythroxylum novogranatense]
MATADTHNPTASVADNATKTTLETSLVASAMPDRVKDSTGNESSTIDSGKDDSKMDGEDPKTGKATAALVSDTEKKIRRAERFGITVQLSEQEKRSSRAERFGTGSSLPASEGSKNSEELKRKARAERFGLPMQSVPTDEDAKKKARLERFAPDTKSEGLEEDKKKARALRFSKPSETSLSLNGKGTVEPKLAIAGKAGGGS